MSHRREKREKLVDRLGRMSWSQDSHARQFSLSLQPPNYTYLKDRYEYIYKFQPARSQKDAVIRLVRQAIEQLNQHPDHGVLMCNNHIQITPSTTAPPIWPPDSKNNNDVKFYTFFRDDDEFPATVPVSIIPREGQITVDKIHVRVKGVWVPIKDWLLRFADTDLLRRRGTTSVTYFFRKRSKQPFRLMDLPVEIRLMIFEFAIAPAGKVYPRSKASKNDWPADVSKVKPQDEHITLGIGYNNTSSQRVEVYQETPPPNLSLLYINKKVKDEALKAGWEGLKRCFVDYPAFSSVAESKIGVATRFNILGHIELSFTSKAWFEFFGIEVKPIIHLTESISLGHHLTRLNERTHLEIRFRDPEDGYIGDPWGETFERTTCQTIMVDHILTLAFEHIKHIKDIKITGFVRKPQKDYWHDILAKERINQPHGHDNGATLKAILNTPNENLPHDCICRKSCICQFKDRWFWDRSRDSYGNIRGDWFLEGTRFDFEDGTENEVHDESTALCMGSYW
ncbi:uncharacterized protein K460DRAFT_350253 [Cucurbitaria berberidis CBS 394.84]|uniref:Uncharacterized protein n=1 Tax=Cucurbitaria berberidis CBS 394.84 TaxID=1168544 RepID=A0A9P4GRF5_9PLEO|nr:uncharacterized protein K460DRAFT_350253 [Cucurbitaria berberidis CBS 394.84]KAF1850154.1 hypothetical protein K460DRAFT_350253 [Cucurbitaria berberidis CBS 394.84]